MYCTCERVQTVTKATKESSMLLCSSTVIFLGVTCQAKTVLPLHTANKQWLMGSYEHDRQIVLFLSAAGTLSHVSDVGIERVSLCVG